jgi:hypothetical protein
MRGKEYRRWKSTMKYISRLKKNMYYWLIRDEETNGNVFRKWRKPKSWKELDEKGGHSKKLKKTPCMTKKTKWEKIDDKNRIKELRTESKNIIKEELNNEQNT